MEAACVPYTRINHAHLLWQEIGGLCFVFPAIITPLYTPVKRFCWVWLKIPKIPSTIIYLLLIF